MCTSCGLFCRSFDIVAYTAFLTMVISTLYISRSLFDHIKKKRQSNNQAAPIPTASGTDKRQSRQQVPQFQLNNNQFNPEVLDSRFLYSVFVLFFTSVSIVFLSIIGSYHFPNDPKFEIMKRVLELGIIQAICLTVLLSYPYVTNDRLRRFIADEYFH